jgi:hypothetical protein
MAVVERVRGPRERVPLWVAVWLGPLVFAAVIVACGGGSSRSGSTSTTLPDVAPTGADFVNITTMTPVGDRYIGSLNGHLAAALAVAHSPTGGVYPVGTVIQLVPQEAMVKRYKGYSPATRDWEFFSLSVSAEGTDILKSGTTNISNPAGGCASCHSATQPPRFDFVCTKSHGCPGLTLTDEVIASIQHDDPRPKK